jgi:hypothetical protein
MAVKKSVRDFSGAINTTTLSKVKTGISNMKPHDTRTTLDRSCRTETRDMEWEQKTEQYTVNDMYLPCNEDRDAKRTFR